MKIIRSTNDRLVDVIVFDPKKNIKLQPVTPLMPLEALLIPVNLTDSDSDGINGGTGCNFINFKKVSKLGSFRVKLVNYLSEKGRFSFCYDRYSSAVIGKQLVMILNTYHYW